MRNVVVALFIGAVVEVVWAAPPQISPSESCGGSILSEVHDKLLQFNVQGSVAYLGAADELKKLLVQSGRESEVANSIAKDWRRLLARLNERLWFLPIQDSYQTLSKRRLLSYCVLSADCSSQEINNDYSLYPIEENKPWVVLLHSQHVNSSFDFFSQVLPTISKLAFQDFLADWFEAAQYASRFSLPTDPNYELFLKKVSDGEKPVLDPDAVRFLFFLYEQMLWKEVSDSLFPQSHRLYQDEAAVRASEYLLKEYAKTGITGHVRWVKMLEINRTTFWSVAFELFQSMENTVLRVLRHRAQWN